MLKYILFLYGNVQVQVKRLDENCFLCSSNAFQYCPIYTIWFSLGIFEKDITYFDTRLEIFICSPIALLQPTNNLALFGKARQSLNRL